MKPAETALPSEENVKLVVPETDIGNALLLKNEPPFLLIPSYPLSNCHASCDKIAVPVNVNEHDWLLP